MPRGTCCVRISERDPRLTAARRACNHRTPHKTRKREPPAAVQAPASPATPGARGASQLVAGAHTCGGEDARPARRAAQCLTRGRLTSARARGAMAHWLPASTAMPDRESAGATGRVARRSPPKPPPIASSRIFKGPLFVLHAKATLERAACSGGLGATHACHSHRRRRARGRARSERKLRRGVKDAEPELPQVAITFGCVQRQQQRPATRGRRRD